MLYRHDDRDYARFGQLFSNGGALEDEQIISKKLVDETFQYVWDTLIEWTDYKKLFFAFNCRFLDIADLKSLMQMRDWTIYF